MAVLKVGIDGSAAASGSAVVHSAMDRVRADAEKAASSLETLAKGLRETGKAQEEAGKAVPKTTNAFVQGYASVNGAFVKAQEGIGGFIESTISLKNIVAAGIVGELLHELVEGQTALEKISDVFRATARSTAEANLNWQFTANLSREMGINFEKTADTFARFQAVTRDTVLEGQATKDIFQGVNEATQAMGLSANDTAGVFQQLQLMMTKGAVNTRQLASLFGDRLPGALNLVAKGMGTTADELTRMIAKGQIAVEDLLPALGRELHNTFGELALENAKDLEAQMERIGAQWKNLKSSIASAGSGGMKGGAGFLEQFVGGLAVVFGNALDPIDALNQRAVKLREQIDALNKSPFAAFKKDELAADKVELAEIDKQLAAITKSQEDQAKLELEHKRNPPPKALTDQQVDAIEAVTNDLIKQNQELALQAVMGDNAATSLQRLDAQNKLLLVNIKALPPEIEQALQGLDAMRKLAAEASLKRSLDEQTGALNAQTKAGDLAAFALQRYQAQVTLAKAGITQLTPAIKASLAGFEAAQRNATIAGIAHDLKEQAVQMDATAKAGPASAQALARLEAEASLSKVGVHGLTAELQALFDKLEESQQKVALGKVSQDLSVATHEFELQAQYGYAAAGALEKYHLQVQLAAAGLKQLTPELEAQLIVKNQTGDAAFIKSLQDELSLMKESVKQRAIDTELRKLSADATDEQKKQVAQLADQIRREQSEQKFLENIAKEGAKNIQDAFANFLFDPFADGLGGMVRGFVDALRKMAAEALAQQAIKALLGALGGMGGGYGAFFTSIAGSVAGARAGGGPVMAGKDYLVGEKGPEVVHFDRPGTVIPNGAFGGGSAPAPQVTVPVQVVNVRDPNEIPQALGTAQSRKVLLNILAEEKSAVMGILNG
jgi:tape measure domain-containing protein